MNVKVVNLRYCVRSGCKNIVNALIDKGADVNAKGKNEKTPLHWAAENGYLGIVKALIKAGANVNIRGKGEETPLHLATIIAHEDVIEALIRRTLIQDFSIQRPYYLTDTFSTCWNRCLDEIKELEEENEPLYDFLRESNINNLVSIWERNENVCSRFDNQESLQEQYPEYAHILINKANEVEKEIFLHNHKPLIDVLSQLGYHEGKTPDRIRAFLEENRDRFKVEFGNPNRSLIDFVSFEDIKARHVPELELRAVVSRVIGKNTPSRNLLNPNSEQHQAVGLLYS